MKKYRVIVNGKEYEVEIEEIGEAAARPAAPDQTAKPEKTEVPSGSTSINAPMPGTVLSVSVSDGSAVKKGDVLMILEAMKMENEILAPCDGSVSSLKVSKGSTVETGALLCTIG